MRRYLLSRFLTESAPLARVFDVGISAGAIPPLGGQVKPADIEQLIAQIEAGSPEAVDTLATGETNRLYAFTFDGSRRLTHLVMRAPGLGRAVATRYTYDAAGNLSQLIYPDGYTVIFSYDAVNRMLLGLDSDRSR